MHTCGVTPACSDGTRMCRPGLRVALAMEKSNRERGIRYDCMQGWCNHLSSGSYECCPSKRCRLAWDEYTPYEYICQTIFTFKYIQTCVPLISIRITHLFRILNRKRIKIYD